MKVTFPRFGSTALAVPKLLKGLGIETILPPENDEEMLKRGASISPEEMCIPFKYMAGNLMWAYEHGADTAVMAATAGPCRLGEYGQLLEEVLNQAGCRYRWIILDAPSDIGVKELGKRLTSLWEGKKIGFGVFARNTADALRLVQALDRLEKRIGADAGFLREPYQAVRLLHETEQAVREAETFAESFSAIRAAKRQLKQLPADFRRDPVKILITGEIYTSMEREANHNLEEQLMKAGCSIRRHITLSWWIRHTLFQGIGAGMPFKTMRKKVGIPDTVGGYGRETIVEILKRKKPDGVIKIMPSGCMPEIVTKAFCEKLKEQGDRQILHLIFDEMSGTAGYETRVEAFVDMLERRKDVLAGNRHWFHKHGFRYHQ